MKSNTIELKTHLLLIIIIIYKILNVINLKSYTEWHIVLISHTHIMLKTYSVEITRIGFVASSVR